MYQYSFNKVSLQVDLDGVPLSIVNVPDMAQIFTMSRRAETKHDVMGARGEMNVATTVNKSGTLTFPLMQTAPENILLTAFQIQAEQDGAYKLGGSKIVNAFLTDMSSAVSVGSCLGGYIPGPAALTRGNTVNFLVWTIHFETVDLVHGSAITTSGTSNTKYYA